MRNLNWIKCRDSLPKTGNWFTGEKVLFVSKDEDGEKVVRVGYCMGSNWQDYITEDYYEMEDVLYWVSFPKFPEN